ncbi:hypothetical protein GCM10027612_08460 [Microbispora bryophytorum subsp. camponoti]
MPGPAGHGGGQPQRGHALGVDAYARHAELVESVLEDGELGAARAVGQHDAGHGVRDRLVLGEPPRHRARRSAQIDGEARVARTAGPGPAGVPVALSKA